MCVCVHVCVRRMEYIKYGLIEGRGGGGGGGGEEYFSDGYMRQYPLGRWGLDWRGR